MLKDMRCPRFSVTQHISLRVAQKPRSCPESCPEHQFFRLKRILDYPGLTPYQFACCSANKYRVHCQNDVLSNLLLSSGKRTPPSRLPIV